MLTTHNLNRIKNKASSCPPCMVTVCKISCNSSQCVSRNFDGSKVDDFTSKETSTNNHSVELRQWNWSHRVLFQPWGFTPKSCKKFHLFWSFCEENGSKITKTQKLVRTQNTTNHLHTTIIKTRNTKIHKNGWTSSHETSQSSSNLRWIPDGMLSRSSVASLSLCLDWWYSATFECAQFSSYHISTTMHLQKPWAWNKFRLMKINVIADFRPPIPSVSQHSKIMELQSDKNR